MNKRLPLLGFLLAYAIGIAVRAFLPSMPYGAILVGFILLSGWVSWAVGVRSVLSAVLVLGAFGLGMVRTDRSLLPSPRTREISEGPQVFEGRISGFPRTDEKGSRFPVQVDAWKTPEGWKAADFTVQLSARDGTPYVRGQRVRFRTELRHPRNLGNRPEWDYERYLSLKGVHALGSLSMDRPIQVKPGEGSRFWAFIDSARQSAFARADHYMSPETSALFRSLVLGDRSRLTPEVTDTYRRAGILHILVVSGSHLAWIFVAASAVVALLLRTSATVVERVSIRTISVFVGAAAALFYSLHTDLEFPTFRALLALGLVVTALLIRRSRDPLHLWVVVALGLLLLQPLFLMDVSAQLSMGAVLGILLAWEVGQPLISKRRWSGIPRGIALAAIATLGATVVTTPILLWHFSRVSILSFPGNLLFDLPLGGIAIPAGVVATFLRGALEPLGNYLLCCLDVWLTFWTPWVERFGSLPGGDVWIPRPPLALFLWCAVASLVLYLWTVGRFRLNRERIFVGLLTLLIVSVPYLQTVHRTLWPSVELHFLSVGQGDSTFVQSDDGRRMLIDAGPGGDFSFDAGAFVILPWLRFHGVDHLDHLILTHGDADHAGGAISLVQRMSIGELWLAPTVRGRTVDELLVHARERGVRIREIDARSPPNSWGSLKVRVLSPPGEPLPSEWNENDGSVVVEIESGAFRAWITGDIERNGEWSLVRNQDSRSLSVLKAAHHGSRTSSTEEFLTAFPPHDVVVQAGWKNRFGHPHPEVIERFRRHGATLWRTDQCGEIAVLIDENDYQITPGRPCANGVY